MSDNAGVLICPHCHVMLTITAVMKEKQLPLRQETADVSDLEDLLETINSDSLDEGELEFVNKTRARFKKYKDKTLLTPKQMDWLRRLAKKGF